MTDITVPTLGESVSEATVGEWQVSEGDQVKKDDVLVELETDKVSVEVRAESDGVITAISAREGDTVEIGAKLGDMDEGSGGGAKSSNGEAKSKSDNDAGDETEAAKSTSNADTGSESESGGSKDSKGSGELIEAKVPVMGESVSEGTVGAWMVNVGDSVEQDQAILEIETDKVAVEVPAPAAGVLEEQLVDEGDTVEPDQVVARIREGGSGESSEKSEPSEPSEKSEPSEPSPAKSESQSEGGGSKSSGEDRKAMPAARRVAEENDLDLSSVEGTGKDGRVTKGDALKALEGAASSAKAPEPASKDEPERETGEREERVKMTRLRQTIARRLKEAQNTAAMLTTYNEADMSAIMALRKEIQDDFVAKHAIKLGFMSFFVKACVNRAEGIARGQCRGRRDRHRLQELLRHGRGGRHRSRPGRAGGARL